jgi:GT2 family glycosyltransferase
MSCKHRVQGDKRCIWFKYVTVLRVHVYIITATYSMKGVHYIWYKTLLHTLLCMVCIKLKKIVLLSHKRA